jgi:hypothetical protein
MQERTVDEQNLVDRAKILARVREESKIFREVFGLPGERTRHGQVILDVLHRKFGRGLPKNVCDDHGRTDALQTWRNLGHYDVLEAIHETITWKESDHAHSSSTP